MTEQGILASVEFQMSLLTTIIPPLILRNWFFRHKDGKKPEKAAESDAAAGV